MLAIFIPLKGDHKKLSRQKNQSKPIRQVNKSKLSTQDNQNHLLRGENQSKLGKLNKHRADQD